MGGEVEGCAVIEGRRRRAGPGPLPCALHVRFGQQIRASVGWIGGQSDGSAKADSGVGRYVFEMAEIAIP